MAELIVGLTVRSRSSLFDSATPGTISTIGPITGLTAGDTLVGIDRRPQDWEVGLSWAEQRADLWCRCQSHRAPREYTHSTNPPRAATLDLDAGR